MVNLLVKFVHADCLFDPSNQCRAYLEARCVNLNSYEGLEESVEDFVLDRVELTHKDDNAARNLRFKFFISVSWEIHGEAVSRDLGLMNSAEFGLQVKMIERRGCTDILVVNYRYYVATGESGPSRLRVRGGGKTESEGSGESHGAYDIDEKGQMAYPDDPSVGGYEGSVTLDREDYDRGSEKTGTSVTGGDGNSRIHVDSHSHPGGPDMEQHHGPSSTPSAQANPTTLTTDGPEIQVQARLPLTSLHQTKSSEDEPSSITSTVQPVAVDKASPRQGSMRSSASTVGLLAQPRTPTHARSFGEAESYTPPDAPRKKAARRPLIPTSSTAKDKAGDGRGN
ncbi:hypothetical protein E0Z10_g4925 [Xylaria hypoxylon]|uniref:Uncharacterized protein n=1 Tax=Xylaria hypoxylon TaxID=37992 RepID=A0A4Z0YX92_9PEZI|nr:hypothetical protein E0Z10_g4925 [Xylaria hypoxylon]